MTSPQGQFTNSTTHKAINTIKTLNNRLFKEAINERITFEGGKREGVLFKASLSL